MPLRLPGLPSAALSKTWAVVPDPGCRGLCVEACGPILMSPMEAAIMKAAGGRVASPTDVADALIEAVEAGSTEGLPSCPSLVNGRCTAYAARPIICRLWGAVEDMPCLWGCVPEGGRLSAQAGRILLRAVESLSNEWEAGRL